MLRWELFPTGVRMHHQGTCILVIVHLEDGSKVFSFDGRTCTMRTSGTWKLRTTIHCDGQEMLRMEDAGFFKRDRIVLMDGSVLTIAWKNAPLAKLVLRDAADKEVLSARLATEGGVHNEIVMAAGLEFDLRTALLLAFMYERFGDALRGSADGGDLILLVA